MGRIRRRPDLRCGHGPASSPGRQDRRGACTRDKLLWSIHRGFRHRGHRRRSGHARRFGGRLGARTAPAFFAACAVSTDSDPDRVGDDDHADSGDGHADHRQEPDERTGRKPRAGRSVVRCCNCRRHHRHEAQGDGDVAQFGTGRGHSGRVGGWRPFRPLRLGRDSRGIVGGPSNRRMARPGPRLRTGLLEPSSGVRDRCSGRHHAGRRQFRCRPGGFLAPTQGRGLPRGAGLGGSGGNDQPARRPRGHTAKQDPCHQRVGGRADRDRGPPCRDRGRGGVHRSGIHSQGHRHDSGDSGTGYRGVPQPY